VDFQLQSSVSHDSLEIILICWFDAQEIFLLVLIQIFVKTVIWVIDLYLLHVYSLTSPFYIWCSSLFLSPSSSSATSVFTSSLLLSVFTQPSLCSHSYLLSDVSGWMPQTRPQLKVSKSKVNKVLIFFWQTLYCLIREKSGIFYISSMHLNIQHMWIKAM